MERAEMIQFKKFVEIYEETTLEEALNVQQRMKLKQSFKDLCSASRQPPAMYG